MSDKVREAFETLLLTYPLGAQNNVRDSMARGESMTIDFFHAGVKAGRESMREEAIKACEERTDRIQAIKELP